MRRICIKYLFASKRIEANLDLIRLIQYVLVSNFSHTSFIHFIRLYSLKNIRFNLFRIIHLEAFPTVAHCLLPTSTGQCLLSIAHCPLFTAHCLRPTVYCPLYTTPVSNGQCLLPIAYCPLSTAHCLLPTVYNHYLPEVGTRNFFGSPQSQFRNLKKELPQSQFRNF